MESRREPVRRDSWCWSEVYSRAHAPTGGCLAAGLMEAWLPVLLCFLSHLGVSSPLLC